MTGFTDTDREELRADALAAAKRCIGMCVEGDPETPDDGHAAADRKANAQAALALVQTARTLEPGWERRP